MKDRIKIPLVLASSSERRIILLKKSGIYFISVNHKLKTEPEFNDFKGKSSVERFVCGLALEKAKSLQEDYPENFIIGADTVIYQNGAVYGKPANFKNAFDEIKELSGKSHEVYTGISLINKSGGIYRTGFDKTTVKIKPLNDSQIRDYINNYPPFDKAGSYGIQDKNGIVESYEGSFENVLGLPVQKLIPLLNEYKINAS